jgi:predicted nucleotidyltransferase
MKYPTIAWLKSELRYNLTKPLRIRPINVFIIGSYARNENKEESDLDIAIVIPTIRGKTSLQYSANYHSCFTHNRQKPSWHGIVVDIQFFYVNDAELDDYPKIELF